MFVSFITDYQSYLEGKSSTELNELSAWCVYCIVIILLHINKFIKRPNLHQLFLDGSLTSYGDSFSIKPWFAEFLIIHDCGDPTLLFRIFFLDYFHILKRRSYPMKG